MPESTEMASETTTTAAPPAPTGRKTKGAAAKAAPAGGFTLLLKHGSYKGPGCPSKADRLKDDDKGFDYDHDHPAKPGERINGLSQADYQRLLKTKSFETLEQFEARTAEEAPID